MDSTAAVQALGALAQPSRLAVFRTLVRHGPHGLLAGELAAAVEIPPSTLSFHLHDLCAAGLLQASRTGRSIRYAVRTETWNDLLFHLGEDCCQGRPALCTSPAARLTRPVAPTADPRPAVLFLCSQNSARSQLAEALLRHLAGDRFRVHSAGVRPSSLHPRTLAVLTEAGIPTDELRSKDLGALLGKVWFDHAFVVCDAAHQDCLQLPVLAPDQQFWPFPDPAAVVGSAVQQLAAFRTARDTIRDRIASWLRGQRRNPQPQASSPRRSTRTRKQTHR